MFTARKPEYCKRTYLALGKMLVKKRPEVANELLPYCPNEKNITALDDIPEMFLRFCIIQNIQKSDYLGKLNNYEKTRQRRVFVAVMLHFYCQEVFQQPPDSPIIPYGLLSAIGKCIDVKRSYISQLVRQVLYEERQYDDFRDEVAGIVSQLKSESNGQA